MALKVVGVRAVVKDFGKFRSDMSGVASSIKNTRMATVKLAAAATGVGAALLGLGLIMKGISQSFKNAGTIIKTVFISPIKLAIKIVSGLLSGLRDLASSVWSFVSPALERLSEIIKELAKDAFEGAVAFQKLSIRFQGLVANELIATDRAEDFAEAMEMASVAGADLLNWVQQLALTTPFTRRDISETVAFSMAMGFTSEEAKKLTLAIGNFVSGMGLSSEVMERIILQFGQMQAGGKLFGTELRDLARGAFVPVNEIIKEVAANLDMTAAEWQELAARGETDIQPFFEEFIEMANTRFPNAMERMNKTLEAVIQNMGEFVREFLGVKTLLPSIEVVSGQISKALEGIATPTAMRAFELAGVSVGKLTKSLVRLAKAIAASLLGTRDLEQVAVNIAAFISFMADKVREIVDSVVDRFTDMGVSLAEVASDAFVWGVNVVASLAEGVIVGASRFLTQAMNFISDLLMSWLAPGSAPKVAPDLPKWGAAALTEWLKGFSEADFDVLKDIQSPIKSALDVFVSADLMSRKEAGKTFASLSKGLIEGIAGGDVASAIKSITRSLGEFGSEIASLIKLELKLADATEAVRMAEDALEASRKRHADAVIEVAKETARYNKLLRGGQAGSLAQVNAAEMARNIAEEQVGVAEDNLQVAQDALDPIEEQVSLQKELINQLIEIAKAQFGIKDAASKAAGKGGVGGITEEIEKVKDSLTGLGTTTTKNLDDAFRKAKENIRRAWDNLFDPIGKRWNESVGVALKTLGKTFKVFKETTLDPVLVALGLKERQGWMPSELEIRLAFLVFYIKNELIPTLKDELGRLVKTFTNTVLPNMGEAWKNVKEGVQKLAKALGIEGLEGTDGLTFWLRMVGLTAEGISTVILALAEAFNAVAGAVVSIGDAWRGLPSIVKQMLTTVVTQGFGGISSIISGIEETEAFLRSTGVLSPQSRAENLPVAPGSSSTVTNNTMNMNTTVGGGLDEATLLWKMQKVAESLFD